ncbi:hypothetical protein ACIBRY_05075 [Streptomyces anulatus]
MERGRVARRRGHAVRDLESERHTFSTWTGGDDRLIRDALEESGEGPSPGGMVYVQDANDPYDEDADLSVDRFEVTTNDVDAAFCPSVSPPEPESTLENITVGLHHRRGGPVLKPAATPR